MSQNTRTPESRGSFQKLCPQGRDTLNVPSPPPVELELKAAFLGAVPETNTMKELLSEFKALYEERLMRVEMDVAATIEETLQNKVDVLQSYVNDLADQNQVLVQTVEDLQKEANHDVCNVGMKPHTSDGIPDGELSHKDACTVEQSSGVGRSQYLASTSQTLANMRLQ